MFRTFLDHFRYENHISKWSQRLGRYSLPIGNQDWVMIMHIKSSSWEPTHLPPPPNETVITSHLGIIYGVTIAPYSCHQPGDGRQRLTRYIDTSHADCCVATARGCGEVGTSSVGLARRSEIPWAVKPEWENKNHRFDTLVAAKVNSIYIYMHNIELTKDKAELPCNLSNIFWQLL